MDEIDWSKAPDGFPIWIEDLRPEFGYDASGWHKEHSAGGFSDREGERWSEAGEGSDYRVHRKPESSALWNGEGLPPVGTVCSYQHMHHPGAWYDGEVLYISDEYTIVKGSPVGEQHYYTRNLTFRPIRTAEQIAEQRAAETLARDSDYVLDIDQALALVRSGYRKQEAP